MGHQSKIEFLKAKKLITEDYKNKMEERKVENEVMTLVRLSKIIFSLYLRLYNLEIEGKKDTVNYNIELRNLRNIIKTEKAHYGELLARPDSIFSITEYIYFLLNGETSMDILKFEDCISGENADLIVNRVALTLNCKIINQQLLENKINGISIDEDIDLKQDAIETYVSNEVSKKYLEISQDNVDDKLNYIDKKIKMDGAKNCIKKIISLKYTTPFLYLDIEHCMLDSKFEITPSTFLDFDNKLPFDIDDDSARIRKEAIKAIAEEAFIDMLKYNDNSLIDIDNKAYLISRQYSLKAALLFLNEEDINNLYIEVTQLPKYINDNNYIMSKRMINDAFENVISDKEKYLTNNQKIKKI